MFRNTALSTRFFKYLRGFHPAGLIIALMFFTWSLTPSLLPRMWYLQALATGVSLATGYGIGVLGLKLWRWTGVDWRPSARVRRIGWWVLAAVAVVVIPLFSVLGAQWQHEIRALLGVEQDSRGFYVLVLILGFLVAALLIQAGRGIGGLVDGLVTRGRRFLPAPAARLGSILLVLLLAWALLEGVLLRGVLAAAEWAAAPQDQTTREGIERPLEPERSGSPESAEGWETLGRDGRGFVSQGPRAADITEVTGREAREPIRAYAGVAAADTVPEIAEHAIAELHRTGAFERSVLLVVTTTGRGWVNTAGAESLEYLTGGDSAIVSMQYSYLQSPMAFLADRNTPLEAGRVLLEKVHAQWSEMPEDDRPQLLVMGESLGSYGAQGAVGSEQGMIASLDGGLLIGTPNFAEPWHQITEDRDPGSLERLPIIDNGRNIRFASRGEDLGLPTGVWEMPRFVYWQHAGDPITWWSFDLLLNKPDWLAEERGPDVHPGMRWLPFVTFWQVTADMAFSVGVPAGFGHNYGEEAVDLWVGILEPEDWAEPDTERVREILREPDTSLTPLGEYY